MAAALSPLQAFAKDAFAAPHWAWRLAAGSGDFGSPGAVMAAFNAKQEEYYASESTRNCGNATKIIYSVMSPAPWLTSTLNGEFTSYVSDEGVQTTYNPACYENGVKVRDATGPTVVSAHAGIGAYGRALCPPELAWYSNSVVEGSNTRQWCQASIPDSCDICHHFGNPIDALGAAKVAFETDYESPDALLRVARRYSSLPGRWYWSNESVLLDYTGRNPTAPSPYGLPSMSSYSGSLSLIPAGIYFEATPPAVDTPIQFQPLPSQASQSPKEAWIVAPDGRRVLFSENTPGVFTTSTTAKPSLSVAGTGAATQWLFRSPDNTFMVFDASGQVSKEVYWDGRSVVYGYQANTKTVTSYPGGRQLTFSRSVPAGRFDRVALPDGSTLAYGIDAFTRVINATFPDGTAKTYVYNEPAYTGTTQSRPLWLTGLIDENNARNATYRYDGARPLSTELAGGVNKFSFSYNFTSTNGTASVTDPLGSQRVLYWEAGPDGEPNLKSKSQPGGAGSSATTSLLAFDSAGNLTRRDDFNANRVCWAYDTARNVESSRVQGISTATSCSAVTAANATLPAGSRKTSSQWHPDWRLKTQQAEAGKLTTWVYNGQPDPFNGNAIASCAPADALLPDGKPIAVLCRQIEQATTDTDGHLGFGAALQTGVANRVRSWTYNSYGQVLTAKGPRTDVDDTTAYAYYTDTTADHAVGDLQSVTNALGKATQYPLYDRHGAVLRVVDANDVSSDYTYDLRQRLKTVSTGGQTTSYDYWPTGLLKRLTQPDGSFVDLGYDDAHRLTSLTDNIGNRVEYTLDNAGNRKVESFKDPGGVLARQLNRTMDALGRVQQTTGRE